MPLRVRILLAHFEHIRGYTTGRFDPVGRAAELSFLARFGVLGWEERGWALNKVQPLDC